MSDSYYELVDDSDRAARSSRATDLVRSTWSAAIQHGAPVSALLVRALERCEQRDDTRLSRVMVDLLGGVPAEGDLWVRSRIERSGKQIELVSAEMLALGPDGEPRPVARASGWRLQTVDTAEVVHAPAPPLASAVRQPTAADMAEGLGPQLRAQPGLAMADPPWRQGPASRGSSRRSTSSRARR